MNGSREIRFLSRRCALNANRPIGTGREKMLRKMRNNSSRKKVSGRINPAILILVLLLLFAGIYFGLGYFKSGLTGFATITKESIYTHEVNSEYGESAESILALEKTDNVKSFTINGKHSRDADLKVYLENNNEQYLVLDTSAKRVLTPITSSATGRSIISPLVNAQAISNNGSKKLSAVLKYKLDSEFDTDNDGVESINGVIDFDISLGNDSEIISENLCSRWIVYSIEEDTSNVFCNGNSNCCGFVGLTPKYPEWDSSFYLRYNSDGAGLKNIVSAQIIYVDFNLSVENYYSDISYSNWSSLNAEFVAEDVEFNNACEQTCVLDSLNLSSAKLIVQITKGAIEIDNITYAVIEKVVEKTKPSLIKDFPNVTISDTKGTTINLREHFLSEENEAITYSVYTGDNLGIIVSGDTATIISEKGFAGIRYSYFTANNSAGVAISNIFMINVSQEDFKERTVQNKARINHPVKWTKSVKTDNAVRAEIEITNHAYNISAKNIVDGIEKEIDENGLKIIDNSEEKTKTEYETEKEIERLNKKLQKSGSKEKIQNELQKKVSENSGNATIVIENPAEEIILEYETPAPESVESKINENRKQIKISSEIPYEDIIAYTSINEVKRDTIKLYWLVNAEDYLRYFGGELNLLEEFRKVDITNDARFEINYVDENNNGLIDSIEWLVPHLSNQTYEVSITVLNLHSYPPLWGNWTVQFNTSGTGNLTITAIDSSTYSEMFNDDSQTTDDLELLELRCGENILFNKYDSVNDTSIYLVKSDGERIKLADTIGNSFSIKSIYAENFNCDNQIAYHTIKELSTGAHTQEFNFSGTLAYAYNTVGGTNFTYLTNGTTTNSFNYSTGVFNGTYYNETTASIMVNITNAINNGTYLSQIFDAGSSVTWNNLSWAASAYGGILDTQAQENSFVGGANLTDLVLLLHFNNQSAYGENNTRFYDFSGKDKNGTCGPSCPKINSSGKMDKAINIISEQSVYIPNGRQFFDDDSYTISMWTYVEDAANAPVLLSRESAGDFYLQVAAPNYLYFNLYANAVSSTTNTIALNRWQHIVITKNTSTNMNFFIDGVDATSDGTTTSSTAVTDGLYFGRYTSNGYGLDGMMDEIAIWNRSLSATEIVNLYKRGHLRLNFSARSCDDAVCDTETFTDITDSSPQNLSVYSITNNQYFQYLSIFSTGNLSYSPELYNVTIFYTFVTIPPTVTLDTANATWQKDGNITLKFTATDTSGIGACVLYGNFNGSEWRLNETKTGISSGIQNNFSINLTNGTYLWNVWCNDTVGNSGLNANNFSFYIDSIIPSVTLNAPQHNSQIVATSILFNWTAIDNLDLGLVCNLTVDNVNQTSNVESVNGTPMTSSVSGLSEGTHLWNVTCVDNATNTNTSITQNFTYTSPFTFLTNGTVTTANGLQNTVLNRTFYNLSLFAIQLNSSQGYNNGTFLSQIFNMGASVSWKNISWQSSAYGELSVNGSINMSGNVLLLRFNENYTENGQQYLSEDFSGYHNNASCIGTCSVLSDDSITGKALNVSSGKAVVNGVHPGGGGFGTSSSASLDGLSIYSISMWIKTTLSSQGYIIHKLNHFHFAVYSPGVVCNDRVGGNLCSTINTSDNQWHHVVSRFNSTHASIYVDGTLSANAVFSGDAPNNFPLRIGRPHTDGYYYDGLIDELAIWNRSLSSDEINSIYKRGATRLNLTVRSCDDAVCDTETFTDINESSPQNLSSYNIGNSQYFQYKVDFSTVNLSYSPLLYNVTVFYGTGTSDTVSPNVTLNLPINNLNTSLTSINFNWTVIDDADLSLSCNLTINGTVNATGIASANGTSKNYTVNGFNSGIYYWNITCTDDSGKSNTSETRVFTIDTTAPTVNLDTANNTWQKDGNITLKFTATDPAGIGSCVLYGNFNGTWLSNQSNTNILSGIQNNFSINLTNGTYLWNVWCNDTVGNSGFNTTNYTFYVDTILPKIELVAPLNNTQTKSYNLIFNWTATDNLDLGLTCNLTIDSKVNVSRIESLNGSITNTSVFGFNNGTHYWNVTCIDNATNTNVSATWMFWIDNLEPSVNLDYPQDDYFTSTGNVTFNWTARDNADSGLSCNLTLDGKVNVSGIESLHNISANITINGFITGAHYWNVTCIDNATNWNISMTRNFTVDVGGPTVTLNTANNTWQNYLPMILRFTATDPAGIGACVLYGNFNGTTWQMNETKTGISSGIQNNFSVNLTNGTYLWNVQCNDTAGNLGVGTTNLTFYIDNVIPAINLNNPADNLFIAGSNLLFNWTAIDNLDLGLRCNLTLDSVVNVSGIESLNNTPTNVSVAGLNSGSHYWNVTCIDNATNWNVSATRNFTVDSTGPVINLNTANDTWQRDGNITLKFTATDNAGISSCTLYGNFNGTWLSNQSNSNILSGIQNNFSINLTNGSYLWNVWCNDTVGNAAFNATNYTFYIDTIVPSITLHNPANNAFTSSSVVFNWTAIDNLDKGLKCNITLDGNVNASSIESSNGTPTNITISGIAAGSHYWNVTCIDNATNWNISATINFTRDISPPTVNLDTANDTWQRDGNITLKFTATDISGIDSCILYGNFNGSEWRINQSKTGILSGIQNNFSLNLTNGTYLWNVWCNDTIENGGFNATNYTFYIDSLIPAINLNVPANNLITASQNIIFNWTVIDNLDLGLKCNLTLDGIVNASNVESLNSTFTNITVLGLNSGSHYWNVTCIDNATNWNVSATRNLTVDVIGPSITLDTANDTWQNLGQMLLKFTSADALDISSCTLYGNFNGTDWLANLSKANVLSGVQNNFTLNLSNGTYLWNVQCNDTLNNFASSANNYTFSIDSVKPFIALNAPIDNFNMTSMTLIFNWTAIDNLDKGLKCNLSINGLVNLSLVESINGTPTNVTVNGINDGNYTWNVTCLDNASNSNISETRRFVKDQSAPTITLDTANDTWFKHGNVSLRFTASDTQGIGACLLYGNFNGSWLANQTKTGISSGVQDSFLINLTNGTYLWNVWCNDTVGNYSFSQSNYSFAVDTILPAVELNAPIYNYNTSSQSILFNWTVADVFDSGLLCNITINNKVNFSNIQSLNATPTTQTINGFNEGTYLWNVTCMDNATNVNSSETRLLTVDMTPPVITLNTANDTWQRDGNITLRFIASDSRGIDSCVLFGDFNNSWSANETKAGILSGIQNNFSINLSNRTYLWNVRCNDTVGNFNFSMSNYTFTIDSVPPAITLLVPAHNAQVGRRALFNFTVIDNLDKGLKCNLTLDGKVNVSDINAINGSVTNLSIQGINDTVHYWNVTCVDNASNSNVSATFNFTIDTTQPTVSLIAPSNASYRKSGNVTFRYSTNDVSDIDICVLYGNFTGDWLRNVSDNSITVGVAQNLTVVLSDGTYIWNVFCNDTLENNGFNGTNFTLFVESVKPTIELNNPADNILTNLTIIDFNFTANDNVDQNLTCSLNLDSVVNVSGVEARAGVITNITISGLIQGNHTWNVTCVDNASNSNTSATRKFEIDTGPPSITLSVIPNPAEYDMQNVSVSWQAVDSHLDTTYANLSYANGTFISQFFINVNLTPTNLSAFVNYTITAWANDSAGNRNSTSIVLIMVDTTPPRAFSLLSPADGTRSKNLTPLIDWEDSYDANFLNYSIDLSTTPTFGYVNLTYSSAGIYTNSSFRIANALASFTNWNWRVTAYDRLGNRRFSNNVTRYETYSNTPPSAVNLLTPENNSLQIYKSINFTWNSSLDIDNDNVTYEIFASNDTAFTQIRLNISNLLSPNYYLDNRSILTEGTRYWRVRAYDGFNYSDYSVPFYIRVIEGRINITMPANNSIFYQNNITQIRVQELSNFDWINNLTLTIDNVNYTAVNISNIIWEFNWTVNVSAKIIDVKAIAFNFTPNITSSEMITLWISKVNSTAPAIKTLCSNATYRLNNSMTRITLTVLGDTILNVTNITVRTPSNMNVTLTEFNILRNNLEYTFSYLFNINETGTFTMTAQSNDIETNRVQLSSSFYITENLSNVNLTGRNVIWVKIFDVCGGNLLIEGLNNISALPEPNLYNVEFFTEKPLVTFGRAKLSNVTLLNYTDIGKNISAPSGKRIVAEFELISSIPQYSNVTIMYNYTDIESQLDDESGLLMYKCTSRSSCAWQQLSTALNTSLNIISTSSTNLSVFLIAETATITKTITETVTTGGGSSGGSSGGGGTTRVKEPILVALEIIMPTGISMRVNDSMFIPVIVRNVGQMAVSNISLVAYSNSSEDVVIEFSRDFIPSINLTGQANTDMRIISGLNPGRNDITVTAVVNNPRFNISSKILIEILDVDKGEVLIVQEKLRFVSDVFDKNPECLELKELLTQANTAYRNKEYSKAESLSDAAVETCRNLIGSYRRVPTERYAPARKGIDLMHVLYAAGTLVFVLMLLFLWSRRKQKKENLKNQKYLYPESKEKSDKVQVEKLVSRDDIYPNRYSRRR